MRSALERARTVREQAGAAIAKSLQAISKEFPEVKTLEDIAKMPTAGRFNELVQRGATLEDAFWLANRQELDRRHRAASRQAAISAAQGKDHLSAGVGREAPETVEVPADLAESYREMMPGATDKEIRAAYARYLQGHRKTVKRMPLQIMKGEKTRHFCCRAWTWARPRPSNTARPRRRKL